MNGLLRYTASLFVLLLVIMSGWLAYNRTDTLSNFIVFNAIDLYKPSRSYLLIPDENKSPQLIGGGYPEPQLITEPPLFSPDGQRAAVIYGIGGSQSVYTFSTYDLQAVTCWVHCNFSAKGDPAKGDRHGLAWSPDGRWLSYFVEEREGNPIIELVDKRGQHREQLYDSFFFFNYGYPIPNTPPQWSFDGQSIFVATNANHPIPGSLIIRIDVEAKETTQVIETPRDISEFKISPDGKWLAYVSQNIYVISTQSKPREFKLVLELTEDQHITNLSWSPDSQHLLFNMSTEDNFTVSGNLYTLGLDGEHELIGDPTVSENFAVWSPDGEWIAFIAKNEAGYDLYRVRPDGTQREQLTHLGTLKYNNAPRWFMYPDYPLRYHLLAILGSFLLGLVILSSRYSSPSV